MCDFCQTGSSICKADHECEAAVLADTSGVPFNHYIFAESSFSATLVTAEKDCYREVKALAIGGGGAGGGGGTSKSGGGGSGYIVTEILQIQKYVEVIVGEVGEASTIVTNNLTILSAAAGEDYQGYRGGAGLGGTKKTTFKIQWVPYLIPFLLP